MYAEFYGFRELPFNLTPDPRFLYLNDCYQEALAALGYGIGARKGFISLVGEAGTGKTTLLRRLLDTLDPATRSVLLLNPAVSFDEILEHILAELGIPTDGARKLTLLQRLSEFLIAHTSAGGNVVLLIDEAQDLSPSALEELRLLSNLETAREKILQIVFAGQPELETALGDPGLRQLRQRIALHIRVRPLRLGEVAAYVSSRLEFAGATRRDIFTAEALARIAELSRGIPRVVNVLCDAALLTGFVGASKHVTPAMVEEAWRDYAVVEAPLPVPAAAPPPAPARAAPQPPAAAPPAPPQPPAPDAAPHPPVDEPAAAPPSTPRAAASVPAPSALPAPVPPPGPRRSSLGIPAAGALIAVMAGGLYWSGLPLWRSGVPAPAAAPSPAPPPLPLGEGPVSAGEAAVLVEEFRQAYEARDADRLLALFAADAAENGRHGLAAIATSYRPTLGALQDVRYTLPSFSVNADGVRAAVRAPFVITYADPGGGRGEVRGDIEWALERREGRARIVDLHYRLQPKG